MSETKSNLQSSILNPQSAFMMAGGRSSRMGTDKAWLEIEGRPMIERVLAAALPIAADLSIVINSTNPKADDFRLLCEKWNARLLFDLHDHLGPLGGIHTALISCPPEHSALILACDLPFVTTDFLSLLSEIHFQEMNELTLPLDPEGRLQPLAGIYSTSCLAPVERLLADGILRVDRLCPLVKSRRVDHQELSHLAEAERLLRNINTLAEYRLASLR